jgi:lysophospholipase L1-like esterase
VSSIRAVGKEWRVSRSRLFPTRPWAGVGVFALASSGVLAPLPPTLTATSAAAASPEPVIATGQAGTSAARAGILPRQQPHAAGSGTRASKPVHSRLIVFGDSVANRPACGCQTFVSRYAQLVRDRATVRVDNLAGAGQTTASVLHVLAQPHTRNLVAKADTIVFVAGANDYRHAFTEVGEGRSDVAAYRAVARGVQANLTAAIRKVSRINPLARVITFGYWNAFKDGAVARAAYTPQHRAAAEAATVSANEAIRRAAKATASGYVSSREAFAAAGRLTPLLAADGDHPSRAGNDVLARTLAESIWVK